MPHSKTISYFSIVLILSLFFGCGTSRRDKEAEKVIRLLKKGKYQAVKKLCHYHPSWDPNDSIFHQSVTFIHAYMKKYGDPSPGEYKNITDTTDGSKIIRVYLSKVTDFDTALKFAYIEMDFFNPERDYADMSNAQRKILGSAYRVTGPYINNFYLVRMKKNKPVTP